MTTAPLQAAVNSLDQFQQEAGRLWLSENPAIRDRVCNWMLEMAGLKTDLDAYLRKVKAEPKRVRARKEQPEHGYRHE